ncbi:WD domain, G-beta repeat domain-containing protein [Theileria equi strain WA]|uniref:WD domain, G-beta repeat domain-containing protein n=1 Tax=Theileria equi strain WA TaxID=1537102 RepID=L0B1D2_THEEQ|nr:WD domain, G-beta repeat domain-containing protein [Theileria equi strain WA]AFZ81056.1 WD domain, G-beta repeat domain-containing protein [Theileria equi strain WA]|eukprot:XP_004830722.1 WD domain, G-beta repeat domain-containing protein [Theileria equi strain WA]
MVKIWDNRSRNPVQSFPDASDSITCVEEHSQVISTSCIDGKVRHYDLRKGVLNIDSFQSPIVSFVYSTNFPLRIRMSILSGTSDCYIIGLLDDTIRLVELGDTLKTYKGHVYNNYRIKSTMDPLEKFVISGCCSGDILYYSLDGSSARTLYRGAHKGAVTCIAFSNPQLLTSAGKLKRDLEKNVRESLKSDSIAVSTGRDGALNVYTLSYRE